MIRKTCYQRANSDQLVCLLFVTVSQICNINVMCCLGVAMSFSVSIEDDHVYVKFSGVVDGLDMVRLTADQEYIDNMRRMQNVIYDFRLSEEVSLGEADLKEIVLMSNLESNFTEKANIVIIPKTIEGHALIAAYGLAIKTPEWNVQAAQNYEEALSKI